MSSNDKTFRHYSFAISWHYLLALLLMGGILTWLLSQGVVIDVDSPSYIAKGFLRSPIYPSLIHLSQILFGENVFFPVIVFQLTLLMLVSFYLARILEKNMEMSKLTFCLVLASLILPFSIKWGNFLLSQGIAYPLFLFSVALFFQAIFLKKISQLLYAFFVLTVLVLTRRQFVFMYVVFGVGIIYFWFFYKIAFRNTVLLFLALLLSFLAADLVEKSYHYKVNKHFTTVPHLGMQLIVAPLYLSQRQDAELFTDPIEKKIFIETLEAMEKKCVHAACEFKDSHPPYQHFYLNYNNIHLGALWPVAVKYTDGNLLTMDAITTKMSLSLIAHQWQRWLRLYLGNIVNNIGGYYLGFWLCLCFVVAFFSHLNHRDKFSISFFFTILMTFGNYSLIALVEPAMAPYNFYTNSILLSFLIVFIMKFLEKPFQLDRTVSV